jgi:type IV fimbrial biogenesis protein FimT
MNSYIAFVGTGEGRQLVTNGFLSGNIKICPKIKGEGYSLILSKGGRTRLNKLTNADCSAMR